MPRQASINTSVSDVIEILIEDHKKVSKFFAEFEKIRHHANDETKQTLVETACTELVIHTQVEEEYLYPALREVFDESDLLDEAEVEHNIAKQLIGELESMQPDDELYDAKFTVLGQYVKHHIEEEQNKIFPKITAAKMDFKSLGRSIRQRRDELRSEFGIPDENYEEDEPPQSSTTSQSPHH